MGVTGVRIPKIVKGVVGGLVVWAVVLSTAACRPGPTTGVLAGKPPKGYVDTRVGPGDVLEVKVLGERLPTSYRVEPDGTIDFPFVRLIKVTGLTPPQIARAIAKKLSNGYLRNPQVHVFVKEYKSKRITIFGQVKKAGIYPYRDNMDIVEAITLAGGFTEMADRNATTLTRIVANRKHRIRVKVKDIGEGRIQNFMLRPGDVIYVPKRFF